MLRELHLDLVDMSSVSLRSLMNFSSSLTTLSLFNCELQGTLPVDIFRLPNLLTLSLTSNIELKGFSPLVNLTSPLRFLDLSYNNVSGELPKSIDNLKFLRKLGLRQCNFNGPIPVSLGNLTQLTDLDLSENHFSGEIPSSLSNLKMLSYLGLEYNNLNGKIP